MINSARIREMKEGGYTPSKHSGNLIISPSIIVAIVSVHVMSQEVEREKKRQRERDKVNIVEDRERTY